MQGKPFTSSKGPHEGDKVNFGEAFGVITVSKEPEPGQPMMASEVPPEEAVLLSPYPFSSTQESEHV